MLCYILITTFYYTIILLPLDELYKMRKHHLSRIITLLLWAKHKGVTSLYINYPLSSISQMTRVFEWFCFSFKTVRNAFIILYDKYVIWLKQNLQLTQNRTVEYVGLQTTRIGYYNTETKICNKRNFSILKHVYWTAINNMRQNK